MHWSASVRCLVGLGLSDLLVATCPPQWIERAPILLGQRTPHTDRVTTGVTKLQFKTLILDGTSGTDPGGQLAVRSVLTGQRRCIALAVAPDTRAIGHDDVGQDIGWHVDEPVQSRGYLGQSVVVWVHHGAPPVSRATSRAVRRSAAILATSTQLPVSAASVANFSTAAAGTT